MSGAVQTLRPELANPGETGTQFSKRKRVLIAESDGFTRMVLMLLFRMIGFGVDFTANGLIALSKLRSQPPDALLLELSLSGLPGLELIRWVRSDPQFGNLRIYVFTDAEAMKRTVRKEVQLNVTKIFDKRSTTREDVVKNIILDLSTTEVGIRLHPGLSENRIAGSSKRMVLPGEFDQLVQGVRAQADMAAKCKDPEERLTRCRELLSRVSSLRSCAEVGGLKNLERQARGLAGFLNQLCKDRKTCTDERLNTIRCSVEVLGLLSGGKGGDDLAQYSAAIIDESSPSSKSLSDALTRMGVNAIAFADPAPALEYLGLNWVNVIVVNVPSPELHGLDRESIHGLPLHAATPVIFVSEALGGDTSKERPARVPLVNQNLLLLHEVVLLALNEVHSNGPTGSANQQPLATATMGPIPFGSEEETAATAAPEFSSSLATLSPGTSDTPADLQAWGAPASAEDELSAPGSQPENWIPGEAGNGEGQATLFVQDDQAHNGDIIAEDQFESPPSVSDGAIAEDLPVEHAYGQPDANVADAEQTDGIDQQTVSEAGNAAPDAFVAEAVGAEATSPAQVNFESASGYDDAVAPVESSALSSPPEEEVNGELQARQQECAELREALGKQESEREALVNRIFASENELQCSQAQVQEYRQTVEDLQKQLEEAQACKPDPDTAQRLQEVESELSRCVAELEQARSRAEEQTTEHEAVVAELRRQLATAEAEVKKLQERCAALEQELAVSREAGETFNSRLAQEQQASAAAAQRIGDLERDLSQLAAAAERADAEAKQQAEEHQRAQGELHRQLETAVAAGQEREAGHQQAQARVGELEADLAALRQVREELDGTLKREQETAAELRAVNKDLEKQLQADKAAREAQTAELEQQIAQGVANLARVTAALSKETGERQRSEERAAALNLQLQELHAQSGRFLEGQRADHERIANLEAQLRQRDETVARSTGELEQHKSEGRLLKEQLQKTRELNTHFRKHLLVFKEAHQKLNHHQNDLQGRLESALDSLEKNGSRLEREMAERQRLVAALEGAQRKLQAGSTEREGLEAELRKVLADLKETRSIADREKDERQHLQQALESARSSHGERSRRAELELSKSQAALEFEQLERKRREAQLARMRLVGLEAARRGRLLRNTLQKQTREPLDNLYQSARRLLQLELSEDQKKLAEAMLQDALLVRTRLQEPERAKGDLTTPAGGPDQAANAAHPEVDEFSTKFIEKNCGTNTP